MELAAEFWDGVAQFNQGEFYACHDTLEAIWMEANEPERRFYQGILQMAVACYHLGENNHRGAMILLGEGMNRLRSYSDDHSSIALSHLLAQGQTLLQQLQTLSTAEVDTTTSTWHQALAALPRPQICRLGD
jgi:predicted metal-dependent hydrolase